MARTRSASAAPYGSTGSYQVSLVVNAALEDESHGGTSNNDSVSAQAIDGSSIAVGAGDQLAVVGRSGDADVYSFELTAGQVVNAGLKAWQSIPPFGPRADYGEYTPGFVVLGDINNDSNVDMVSSSYYGGNFSVRLGAGDGTFGVPSYFGNGAANPTNVALADVNGDDKLDVVAAIQYGGYGPGSVGVMLGHGDGTFDTAVGYFAGYGNYGLAVGDLNGDNKPDIVTNDNNSGAIQVLLNKGDGTFGSRGLRPARLLSPERRPRRRQRGRQAGHRRRGLLRRDGQCPPEQR